MTGKSYRSRFRAWLARLACRRGFHCWRPAFDLQGCHGKAYYCRRCGAISVGFTATVTIPD